MSKKAKAGIILAVVLMISAVIAVLVIRAVNDKKNKEDDSGVYLNDNCTHDESYKEPELKVGKYYYNGDTSAKYIEVTADGYLHFKGANSEDFAVDVFADEVEREKLKKEYQDYIKEKEESEFQEVIDPMSALASFIREVELYSSPKEYLVNTRHVFDDEVCVFVSWSVSELEGEEFITGIGYILENENTLKLNDFTRFVYVEDAQ